MIVLRNTPSSYGWISITMHWLMALLIVAMFALGVWMRTLGYYDAWYHDAPWVHKSVGVLLFLLLLFRFSWRIYSIRPTLIGAVWEQTIALIVHRMHYILLFSLMITGYLIPTAEGVGVDVFGWFTMPAIITLNKNTADLIGLTHWYLAWATMALAGVHAAAALKHHVIDHDLTLRRMLGLRPKPSNVEETT